MKIDFLETIKAKNGTLFHMEYHQKRYESVLHSYGITSYKHLEDFIEVPAEGLYRCRLLYDLQGNIECSYYNYKKRAINSLKLVYDDTMEYEKKYADRTALDTLFTKKGDCDDILIVKNALMTDTSIANIAFFDGRQWVTPKQPLLEGTTRARLLEKGFLVARDISVYELKNFSKIALMNAMIDFDIIADKTIEEIIC
ncbi:aminotransferase class IV family protein [Sulfurimonas paralvinellae]|uniref:Branched-chain amino acid aminotransferase n=1 Tax=Sulfurimonas paralvinellae TaxID=317658 RepID=A0A7M1B9C9_9BACT|nr:aminotransferase class IV family protein [Sulfurimonas paralvinellae]QOP46323.1 branched-chain amino acid aminotransferase [Sulfurimonas paralvinellae]